MRWGLRHHQRRNIQRRSIRSVAALINWDHWGPLTARLSKLSLIYYSTSSFQKTTLTSIMTTFIHRYDSVFVMFFLMRVRCMRLTSAVYNVHMNSRIPHKQQIHEVSSYMAVTPSPLQVHMSLSLMLFSIGCVWAACARKPSGSSQPGAFGHQTVPVDPSASKPTAGV